MSPFYAERRKKMSKILIMTDSASDISEAEEKELSIDILPFPIMLGGESYISRVD